MYEDPNETPEQRIVRSATAVALDAARGLAAETVEYLGRDMAAVMLHRVFGTVLGELTGDMIHDVIEQEAQRGGDAQVVTPGTMGEAVRGAGGRRFTVVRNHEP